MDIGRKSRRQIWILIALFIVAMGYRAFSLYPPEFRHGPATVALQACQIMNGAHPIFWPGQTYMGTAGMHLEALIFKLLDRL